MNYKFSTLKLAEIYDDVFKIHVVDMKTSIYLHYMLRVFGPKSAVQVNQEEEKKWWQKKKKK